jgi:hypothetical protein
MKTKRHGLPDPEFCIATAAPSMMFLSVNVLTSTDSAGTTMFATPFVRLLLNFRVLCCCPTSRKPFGTAVRYRESLLLRPPDTCAPVSCPLYPGLASGGSAPRHTGRFLSAGLSHSSSCGPGFPWTSRFATIAHEASTHARIWRAKTPPGSPITRCSAIGDAAFPIRPQGACGAPKMR